MAIRAVKPPGFHSQKQLTLVGPGDKRSRGDCVRVPHPRRDLQGMGLPARWGDDHQARGVSCPIRCVRTARSLCWLSCGSAA